MGELSRIIFEIDRGYDIVSDRFSYRLRVSDDNSRMSSEKVYVYDPLSWKTVLAEARKLKAKFLARPL